MIAPQNGLSSVCTSTQRSASCDGLGVLIAPCRLMSYQSTDAVSPGMKRGRVTKPAVSSMFWIAVCPVSLSVPAAFFSEVYPVGCVSVSA